MLILTRKYYQQLMCLHHWHKGLPTDIQYGKGYQHEFYCTVCGKSIKRWSGHEPISGIIDHPRSNDMNPPILGDLCDVI